MNNPNHSFAGRRVVVTGAAGFIGTALVTRLLDAGAHVVGIDVQQGRVAEGYEHVLGDAALLTSSAIARMRPDYLFHLASIVGVVAASSEPAETRRAILGMTRQFVDHVAAVEGVRFVYVSSSEVYGRAAVFPIDETTPLAPLSAYGQAKRDAESVVLDACAQSELDAVVIRPFNVYGPGQRPDFVMSRFIELAVEGQEITLVDGGEQVRTFTYIDDFIEGLVLAAVYGGDERIFNVSGSETARIAEIAEHVVELSESDSDLVRVDAEQIGRPREIEVQDRIASCSRAQRVLEYEPAVGIREGITRMLAAHPSRTAALAG